MTKTEIEDGNDWSQYQRLVLSDLKELKQSVKEIQDEQVNARVELALIKQKSGLWGAISGCVTAVITIAIAYIKSKVVP